jgi:predicted GNAT family acetyltransferase
MPDPITIVNNPERHRFETRMDGILAQVAYRLRDDVITFTHTEVPEALAGRGIANQLAIAALDHARDHGLKVVPECPFISSYIKRHPEYQPLVVTSA